jgi:hypothetical protein
MQAWADLGRPVRCRPRDPDGADRCRSRWRPAQEEDSATGARQARRISTLIATNRQDRWIFVYGFAKNERSNVDDDEEEALKKMAAHLLSLTAQAISKAELAGELTEVNGDA